MGVHLHVGRQCLLQVCHGLVECLRHFEGAGVGLLRHGEEHGRLPVDRGGAHLRLLLADNHVGHVAQADGLALCVPCHHGLCHLFGAGCHEGGADNVLVAVFIEHTARRIAVHAAHGGKHLREAHAVVSHPFGVEAHLVFLEFAAHHCYLCHAAHAEQGGAHRPVGERAQLSGRGGVGGEAHEHHFAEDARLRADDGVADVRRERALERHEFFGNNLSVAVDVGVPVKFYPHHREAGRRRGAHAAHVGGTVHGGLDGEGDELFDLFGRHARGFGHDHNGRGVEVGENVNFHAPGGPRADAEQEYAEEQHHRAVAQGEGYDLIKHDWLYFVASPRRGAKQGG